MISKASSILTYPHSWPQSLILSLFSLAIFLAAFCVWVEANGLPLIGMKNSYHHHHNYESMLIWKRDGGRDELNLNIANYTDNWVVGWMNKDGILPHKPPISNGKDRHLSDSAGSIDWLIDEWMPFLWNAHTPHNIAIQIENSVWNARKCMHLSKQKAKWWWLIGFIQFLPFGLIKILTHLLIVMVS